LKKIELRQRSWRQLRVSSVVVLGLLLVWNVGIQPLGQLLTGVGLQVSGYSPYGNIQITETKTETSTIDRVVWVDNCNEYHFTNEFFPRDGELDSAVDQPFNSDAVKLWLKDHYGMANGGHGLRLMSLDAAPDGTITELTWRMQRETFQGYISLQGESGRSAYVVHRTPPPELISIRNIGCLF
jgi:hypothetical protein